MARQKTLIDLLDELAPGVRDAFIASINRITGDVQLAALEDAIARGDTAAVVEIIDMSPEFFAPLDAALRSGFTDAGDFTMIDLQKQARAQGARVTSVFGGNTPEVVRWLATQSSRLIVEITNDKREVIQNTLAAAADAGTSPRGTALDLVGRVNRVTGKREGGVVGLTSRQEAAARAAYEELINGDPAYLRRSPNIRDRRFDRTVLRAIREGRGVPPAEARRIVQRYRDGLLRWRGETIARTELLGTVHAAQDEALAQMRRREGLSENAIRRTWDSANDSATRLSHRVMDGQQRRVGEAFISGDGNRLLYPGDTSLGAPGSDVISCRCVLRTDVDFITGLASRLTPEERAAALAAMNG